MVRRWRAGTTRDRGATPVELAVVMPTIFLLFFASLQAAVWFLARSTALHAAQQAVTAQRTYDAGPGAGQQQARQFLTQAGGWLVGWNEPNQIVVSPVGADTTEVDATVRGRAIRVIPLVPLPEINESAHGTVEQFTPVTG